MAQEIRLGAEKGEEFFGDGGGVGFVAVNTGEDEGGPAVGGVAKDVEGEGAGFYGLSQGDEALGEARRGGGRWRGARERR